MNSSQSGPEGPFHRKRVMVTGAAGFVGAALVRRLLADGASVTALVRPQGRHARLEGLKGDLTFFPSDLSVLRTEDLLKADLRPEIIFHLGAYGVGPGQNDPDLMTATNTRATGQMLEYARLAGVGRFVHCGSCFEYAPGRALKEDASLAPVSLYGQSKKAAGELVRDYWQRHKLPVVTLRLFTVYGPGEDSQRLVSSVINAVLKGSPLPLTGGVQTRDFIFVDDVIRAFDAAARAENILGEVFNVATGVETPVKDAVETIIRLMGSDLKPDFGALPYRPNEYWHLSGDISKSHKYLQWWPKVSLEEGLKRTIAWVREQKEI